MSKQAIKCPKVRKAILSEAKERNEQHYVLFVLGMTSGFRISDLLKLRVKDILNSGIFKIKEKKTGKIRTLPIGKLAKKAVESFATNNGLKSDDLIFFSKSDKSKAFDDSTARRIVGSYGTKYGLDLSTHSLRKTFGYMAYKNSGHNIGEVQKLLNHSKPSVTLRYIGIEQDNLDKLVLSIEL